MENRLTKNGNYHNFSMKWFKFLIYFSLWAAMVVSMSNAVQFFTGARYNVGDVTSEMVYAYYGDGLITLDRFMGTVELFFAIFAVITRMKLANFKADGPMFLYILYASQIVENLILYWGESAIIGDDFVTAEVVGYILGSNLAPAIVLCLNYIYFKKRKELFVN